METPPGIYCYYVLGNGERHKFLKLAFCSLLSLLPLLSSSGRSNIPLHSIGFPSEPQMHSSQPLPSRFTPRALILIQHAHASKLHSELKNPIQAIAQKVLLSNTLYLRFLQVPALNHRSPFSGMDNPSPAVAPLDPMQPLVFLTTILCSSLISLLAITTPPMTRKQTKV